jgi:hypothetical protein
MDKLFRINDPVRRDAEVEAWLTGSGDELRRIAGVWFDLMRGLGPDVLEALHDGCPVACVADAPFAYVNTFTAHLNVGFFQGASLPDPARLLEGSGKRMRHVKLRWGQTVNEAALADLITAAYRDIRLRLAAEGA